MRAKPRATGNLPAKWIYLIPATLRLRVMGWTLPDGIYVPRWWC